VTSKLPLRRIKRNDHRLVGITGHHGAQAGGSQAAYEQELSRRCWKPFPDNITSKIRKSRSCG